MADHLPTSTRRKGRRLTKAQREEAQATFLDAYRLNGNIMLSCRKANIDRNTYYDWTEKDELFSFAAHQAERDFADLVHAEFVRRAMQGYEKPVVSMGRLVYEELPVLDATGKPVVDKNGRPLTRHGKQQTERVVSDMLLSMLVKRHFPEYREKNAITVNAILPKQYVNVAEDEEGSEM